MRIGTAVLAGCLLIGLLAGTRPAWGLGGDYEIKPDGALLAKSPDWPEGFAAWISEARPFHGHWVNTNSEFFFRGDATALAAFLERCPWAGTTWLPLIIHAGQERRSRLWGDKKPTEKYDWKVLIQRKGLGAPDRPRNTVGEWVVTVDAWIDAGIRLSDLELPRGTRAESAGEIERFVLTQPVALMTGAMKTQIEARETMGADVHTTDIPKNYWTDAIKALNPIRVYGHRVNIVVVLREKDGVEEGKYITAPFSSYAPQSGDDGFTFTGSPGSEVLDYRRTHAE